LTGAAERTRELVAPALRPAVDAAGGPVLDTLGNAAPPVTGRAYRLMLTGVVPVVYERWWRPALGRVAKGAFGASMADEHRLARMLLALGPGDRVLDVACGPGNFTRDFGRVVGPGGLAVGLDASPTMLARALRDTPPEQHPAVAYVRGDAVQPPLADASFDAVCCFAALHMFADPFAALDGMTRVLAPGGRIALLTSCRLRSAPLRRYDAFVGAASGQRMFERDEITGALGERGFVDLHQRVSGLTQIVGGRLG
jgi:SAM-dependent methyltransferase